MVGNPFSTIPSSVGAKVVVETGAIVGDISVMEGDSVGSDVIVSDGALLVGGATVFVGAEVGVSFSEIVSPSVGTEVGTPSFGWMSVPVGPKEGIKEGASLGS